MRELHVVMLLWYYFAWSGLQIIHPISVSSIVFDLIISIYLLSLRYVVASLEGSSRHQDRSLGQCSNFGMLQGTLPQKTKEMHAQCGSVVRIKCSGALVHRARSMEGNVYLALAISFSNTLLLPNARGSTLTGPTCNYTSKRLVQRNTVPQKLILELLQHVSHLNGYFHIRRVSLSNIFEAHQMTDIVHHPMRVGHRDSIIGYKFQARGRETGAEARDPAVCAPVSHFLGDPSLIIDAYSVSAPATGFFINLAISSAASLDVDGDRAVALTSGISGSLHWMYPFGPGGWTNISLWSYT